MHKQVIEHNGLPVGIVIPDDGALRFIAVKFHVIELDGRLYPSASAVVSDIDHFLAKALQEAA